MKEIFEGKTLEDAINKACDEFNLDPEYLYYSVLEEEKGLLSKKIRIEAYTLTDVIEFAEEYIKTIVQDYGLECSTTTTLSDGILRIVIDTNHNSILIGKNGITLQSLNEVVRNAISNTFQRRFRILLDINDYKEAKYDKLIKMARRIAHEVQRSKVSATLDPMTSDERRVIHNSLSHMHNIKTESSGSGHHRQITISYVEETQKEEPKEED